MRTIAVGDHLGVTTVNNDTLIGAVLYVNRRWIVLSQPELATPQGMAKIPSIVEVNRRNITWIQRISAGVPTVNPTPAEQAETTEGEN